MQISNRFLVTSLVSCIRESQKNCSQSRRARKVHKRALVAVEIYHRLPRDERNVERASARALNARVAREKMESRRVPDVFLHGPGEGGQGRLITVAFCGFVARHDPRAFRGPHCSAPNRSGNDVGQSYVVGEFPSYVKSARGSSRTRTFYGEPVLRSQDRHCTNVRLKN